MEEYYKENYENHPGLSARAGNRILCVTTVVMIGIQFLLVFFGVYDTLPLVLGTQLSDHSSCRGIYLRGRHKRDVQNTGGEY